MVTAFILLQTFLLSWSQPLAPAFNTFLTTDPVDTVATPSTDSDQVHKGIKTHPNHKADYEVKTVVIDAGHGGHDPGCLGGNSREKHLALGIALKLRDAMREAYPDLRIIMTRDDDTFIPLYKRAAIANRNEADLFMSIHCNFMPGSSATRGSETYVMGLHTANHNLQVAKRENAAILLEDDYEKNYDYDPNSPEGHILLSIFQNAYLEQSILFAESVEDHLRDTANRRSRGVKQAGFVVLKETTMPSVLIETGFLSSPSEERFLMSAEGQASVATAILGAFSNYKQKMESRAFEKMSEPLVSISRNQPEEARSARQMQPKAINTSLPPPLQEQPEEKQHSVPKNNAGKTDSAEPKVYTNVYQPARNEPTDHRSVRAQGPVPTPNRNVNQAPPPPPPKAEVQFFVQMIASDKPQNTTTARWLDLPYTIEVVKEAALFKYRARNFQTIDQAVAAKQYLRKRGFSEAFVMAFYQGKRISIDEARTIQETP